MRYILILILCLFAFPAKGGEPVDLELILAVDVSLSMDDNSFRMEMDGYAKAFRDPRVIYAITHGPIGKVVVTLMQWSGMGTIKFSISQEVLQSEGDIQYFADKITSVERMSGGSTSISGAIDFATTFLQTSQYEPLRKVIDISGDGRNNAGRPVEDARDAATKLGITINGLPIAGGEPGLEDYYEKTVIGGPGHFMVIAHGFDDFGQAIIQKLIMEIM